MHVLCLDRCTLFESILLCAKRLPWAATAERSGRRPEMVGVFSLRHFLGPSSFRCRHLKRRTKMSHKKIIRAWKDAEYYANLPESERALLPVHPSVHVEIIDAELAHVAGAAAP